MVRALLFLVGFGMGCTPTQEIPQTAHHEITPLDTIPAPPFPQECRAAEATEWRWVVFSSKYCVSCRRWLSELTQRRDELAARDTSAIEVLVDDIQCPEAIREAAAVGFDAVAIASDADTARWAVREYPTTYVVRAGKVEGVLRGRATVEEVLALQAPPEAP